MRYSDFTTVKTKTGTCDFVKWLNKHSGKMKAGIKSKVCSDCVSGFRKIIIMHSGMIRHADYTNDWTVDEVKLIPSDCDYMKRRPGHAWYLIHDALLRRTYRNRINYLWLKFVKIKSLQNTSGKVINRRNNKSINDSNEARLHSPAWAWQREERRNANKSHNLR